MFHIFCNRDPGRRALHAADSAHGLQTRPVVQQNLGAFSNDWIPFYQDEGRGYCSQAWGFLTSQRVTSRLPHTVGPTGSPASFLLFFLWPYHAACGILVPPYVHACSVAQWYPTLCNPMDYSLPGSSVHGIFQARILERVAISYSRGIFPIQGSKPCLLYLCTGQ